VKELRLNFVETGTCRHPEIATMRGGSLRPVAFPSLVGLITHPEEGTILFDTGYDRAFIEATEPFPERLYRWLAPPAITTPIADWLEARAISPGEVRHIILSHFHGDHASGLGRFPNARIHCARSGLLSVWERSRLSALAAGTPMRLLPSDLPKRCSFFENQPIVPLPADLKPFETGADILGDGSILAMPLPGHCPGHWGVAMRERRALHFLIADAAWSSRAIRENRPPPRLTSALLGDTKAGRRTLAELHALRLRNPDLLLTPSHCAERAAQEAG
jgi:glyoxylase-like metal-dependent hydrolase (beta-lactamase superfamily II)